MAHIFYSYLYHGLKAILGKEPTQEEMSKAIKAIKDYWGENAFDTIAKTASQIFKGA